MDHPEIDMALDSMKRILAGAFNKQFSEMMSHALFEDNGKTLVLEAWFNSGNESTILRKVVKQARW